MLLVCQVPYRLRLLWSKTGQLRFGTATTSTRKLSSPSIPIGPLPTLHPSPSDSRPFPIPIKPSTIPLHYLSIPCQGYYPWPIPSICNTPRQRAPRAPGALRSFPQLQLVSYATRLISSSTIFLYNHHIKDARTITTVCTKPNALMYPPTPLH
jgi:hypothetical protein